TAAPDEFRVQRRCTAFVDAETSPSAYSYLQARTMAGLPPEPSFLSDRRPDRHRGAPATGGRRRHATGWRRTVAHDSGFVRLRTAGEPRRGDPDPQRERG